MLYIDSTVKAVRVYRRGVEITREGSAILAAGRNRVAFRGLCPDADPASLRLFFPAGVSGSDIRLMTIAEAEKDAEKPSDAVREKLDRTGAEILILEEQCKLWKENGNFQNRQSVDIAELEAYIEKFPARMNAAAEKLSVLQKDKERLEKELNELLKEERKPMVRTDLYAKSAGRYRFEVRCYSRSASWDPVYEIHSEGKGETIELRLRAEISQRTGEDWKDAETVLCSGNPAASGDLPVLRPQYLNIKPEMRLAKAAAPMLGAGRNAMMMAAPLADSAAMRTETMVESEEMVRVETPQAEVTEGETMTEYGLGARDIPEGGDGTAADLQKYEIPAKYRYLAVPKLDDRAYLAAEIRTEDLPALMAGKASVYLDGAYTGDIRLSPDGTEESIRISLGKEEKITVQRREVRKKSAAALLKNQKTTEYGYEILISNKKEEAVKVLVTDQIPVSQDKTITVETLESDRGKLEAETGLITWEIDAAPQKTETRRLAWRVGWPKDKEIHQSSQTVSFQRFCPECGAAVTGKYCPVCGAVVS